MFRSKRSASHLRLDGKVAIITGAASGIGAATARLFVSHGAKVLIADIKASAGKKLSSELGSSAHFFRCDVTNEADIASAVDYAVQAWGHLDIMFNNAGVSGPIVGLANVNIEELDQVMAVHIKGAVLGVKHAARVMIPVGKGVILFSGSTSVEIGGAGPPLHSAANAAVLSIVRSAAAELVRHGIRVNAVSPHCVATPMSTAAYNASAKPKTDISLQQFERLLAANSELDVLTTEKVATAVMYLAGDDAGFISGHNLVLDGAFSVTKQFDLSNLTAALEKLSPSRELKAAEEEGRSPGHTLAGNGSGIETNALTAKERETDDKARAKEERAREKDEKAAQKALAKKEKEDQKQAKAKDKQDKEVEKALAKETKSSAEAEVTPVVTKEVEATPPKDPINAQQASKDDPIHPLDKKASAKEERIRNEIIELPNAGPEPDIPTEFRARSPVRKIGSLLSWRKPPSKKDKTEGKSTDVVNVPETTPKSDKSPDGPGVSVEDKKDNTATEPAKVSQAEGKPPAKDAKAGTEISDSPKTAASQPKQSPIARITNLLTPGTDPKRKDKTEGESTNPEGESTNPEKDSMTEAKPAAVGEKAQTDSTDAPPTPAAASKPKQTTMARIAKLLNPGRDSKNKDKVKESTDKGKASEEELKKDQKPTEPEIENVSKPEEAKPTANEEKGEEKAETDSTSSPSTTSAAQQKQSPMARIVKLLTPGKDSKKKDRTENEAAAQASKEEKKEEKPTEPEQISKDEVEPPAKEEKAATESTSSPKASAASPPKQSSPPAKIAQSSSPEKDSKEKSEAEDAPTDQDTTPNEDKKDDNSIEPEIDKVPAVEAKPAVKEEQAPDGPSTDSPTTAASKPKQSPAARIAKLFTKGKNSKKKDKTEDKAAAADQTEVLKEENLKFDDKSTDPGEASTSQDTKPPTHDEKANEEKAETDTKDTPKTATSQPKESPVARILKKLNPAGKHPEKEKQTGDEAADPGQISKDKKEDDQPTEPELQVSKEDAIPPVAEEVEAAQAEIPPVDEEAKAAQAEIPPVDIEEAKAAQAEIPPVDEEAKAAQAESVDAPTAAASTPKQSPMARLMKMLSGKRPKKKDKTEDEAAASKPKKSLLARIVKMLTPGKAPKKKDKTEDEDADPGQVSKDEKEDDQPTEPEQVSKEEAKPPAEEEKGAQTESIDTPVAAGSKPKQSPMARIMKMLTPGKGPKKKDKTEDEAADQGKGSTEEMKDDKATETEQVTTATQEEPKPPAEEEKTQTDSADSPLKSAASPPKQSPIAKIAKLLTPGKDSSKGKDKAEDEPTDPAKVSKQEEKADLSPVPEEQVSKSEEAKSPAEDLEKAPGSESAESPKTAAPKKSKIAKFLSSVKDPKGKDKVEDEPGTDLGKVSEVETKDDKLSADPGKESKEDAKPAAEEETAQTESADSPPKTSVTPLPKSPKSPIAKLANLLTSKKDDPTEKAQGEKKESTDPAAKVEPKEDKKDDKSAESEKVSTEEAAEELPQATEEKASQTEGTDSPKTAPAPPKKQSFMARMAKLLNPGRDSVKKDKTESGTDLAKRSKKEEALKAPAKEENAPATAPSKASPKTAADPEITTASQPKPEPLRI